MRSWKEEGDALMARLSKEQQERAQQREQEQEKLTTYLATLTNRPPTLLEGLTDTLRATYSVLRSARSDIDLGMGLIESQLGIEREDDPQVTRLKEALAALSRDLCMECYSALAPSERGNLICFGCGDGQARWPKDLEEIAVHAFQGFIAKEIDTAKTKAGQYCSCGCRYWDHDNGLQCLTPHSVGCERFTLAEGQNS